VRESNSTARRAWFARLACAVLLAACSPDPRITVPDDAELTATGGDVQTGLVGQDLDEPLSVSVVGRSGEPRAGVMILWSADGGGTVAPDTTLTDAHGVARATWTLGPQDGEQTAHATSARFHQQADFTAIAQTAAGTPPIIMMNLATPDGSGQTVHPDVAAMPDTWTGASRYLVITPYTFGNAGVENPSLFSGHDGFTWHAPDGVVNPLVTPERGYLSDPDALYDPASDELWVYYRAVTDANVIELLRSRDGRHFGAPTEVARGKNHTVVSPTVVRRAADDWLMWAVNANVGCTANSTYVALRRSTDGLHWSTETPVHLTQAGFYPWHIDVQWIPTFGQYWAIYNVKLPGSCSTPALYLATSADGINWTTYPSPVLARGAIPEFADIVYRSSFSYDAATDMISFWYSGARYESPNYIWRSAFQRRSSAEVFASIRKAAAPAAAAMLPRSGVPLLLRAP
jgi:hypothetical protein